MHQYQKYNLLIDSSKRFNQSESNTDFNVNLQNSYKIKACKLKIISIPLTIYNIDSFNGTFTYYDASSIFNISIPSGFYSITSLIADVNQQISSMSGLLLLSYNITNGLFSFVQSDNSIFYVTPQSYPLLQLLGFPATGWANTLPFVATSICPIFINNNYFTLNINYLNTNQININNINSNSTFIIEIKNNFMNQVFGDTLFIQNNIDDSGGKCNIYMESINLQNFRVSLCDKNNLPLKLNGVDWYAIIELYVESNEKGISMEL